MRDAPCGRARRAALYLIASVFLIMTLTLVDPAWAADITVTMDGKLLAFDVPPSLSTAGSSCPSGSFSPEPVG